MDQDYESAPDAVVDAVVRASRALVSITVRALASVLRVEGTVRRVCMGSGSNGPWLVGASDGFGDL